MALVALLLAGACRPAPDPAGLPVAEIDGKFLTVADLGVYLDETLILESAAPRMSSQDLDRVRSRLFDDFVDQQVLLVEAARGGVEVSDREIEAYLRAGENSEEPDNAVPRRERARRDLLCQKVREIYLRGSVVVTPDEVEAFLAEPSSRLGSERLVTLRSLQVASTEQGRKIREEVASRRMTFNEAVLAFGAAPGQGEPLEVTLESLPPEVRAAVEDRGAGRVTGPIAVQGQIYVFYVEAVTAEGPTDPERLRRRVAERLLARKYEEASRSLTRQLREKLGVTLFPRNLPFRYLTDAPDGGEAGGGEIR